MSYCRNTSDEEEKELKRLKEEVAMLGRLRHPNIVRCLGATQVPGHFNIFVEWMAGQCVMFFCVLLRGWLINGSKCADTHMWYSTGQMIYI